MCHIIPKDFCVVDTPKKFEKKMFKNFKKKRKNLIFKYYRPVLGTKVCPSVECVLLTFEGW